MDIQAMIESTIKSISASIWIEQVGITWVGFIPVPVYRGFLGFGLGGVSLELSFNPLGAVIQIVLSTLTMGLSDIILGALGIDLAGLGLERFSAPGLSIHANGDEATVNAEPTNPEAIAIAYDTVIATITFIVVLKGSEKAGIVTFIASCLGFAATLYYILYYMLKDDNERIWFLGFELPILLGFMAIRVVVGMVAEKYRVVPGFAIKYAFHTGYERLAFMMIMAIYAFMIGIDIVKNKV